MDTGHWTGKTSKVKRTLYSPLLHSTVLLRPKTQYSPLLLHSITKTQDPLQPVSSIVLQIPRTLYSPLLLHSIAKSQASLQPASPP